MPRPSILIVTPHAARANNGNWRTATRWARMLREHFRVIVQAQPMPEALVPADCLVALHARRSHAVIRAWHERNPGRPAVVVLTGTDLYRDLPGDLDARDSLAIADRLVVLQEEAVRALPREHRRKARVVYQSARALRPAAKLTTRFHCLFVGHLREEKDPVTALRAWARLPPELPVHLTLVGGALDQALAEAVGTVASQDPRVRWRGARPHGWTRQAIKRAHLLIVPSLMEGGANVIAEAVTAGTPVLASRVPGNVGMLGRGYRGYFPAGDAARLAQLIQRFRDEAQFRRALIQDCRARRALFAPARERAALLQLMREVWHPA
jgi:putative glycosyltransferase (TIGR04348 family)